MSTIHCKATLFSINARAILLLPKEASEQLPSRGQAMVKGTINSVPFQTPLEPDGRWSHWFSPDKALLAAANATVGDTVTLEIEPLKAWPEPEIPADWQAALATAPEAYAVWAKATPMAHWEWIRWLRSTGRDETRKRRLEVGISKLKAGERRPCCWNRNMCTEPSLSKNGTLLEPSQAANS